MPPSKYAMDGKVALVTGAGSGIGRAAALAFARSGAHIVVSDIGEKSGMETAGAIEQIGRRTLFVPCDVSRDADVRQMMRRTMDTFGRLDFAFNNAGIEGAQALTQDSTEENWSRVIDVNLKGAWLCLKHELALMLRQGSGAIVNCSSIAGLVGFTGIPAYVASKHGVIGLTKAVALECAKTNVRVNAVCPGVIQTPMIERFTHGEAQVRKQLIEGEPVGRIGKPEEVANAVLWLCSEDASFVTGHSMAVDGGWVAQ